jgi:hypothetical protein
LEAVAEATDVMRAVGESSGRHALPIAAETTDVILAVVRPEVRA